MGKLYVYYDMERPLSADTCPQKGLVRYHNYKYTQTIHLDAKAWGYAVYDRELTLHEVCDYKLKYAGEYEEDRSP